MIKVKAALKKLLPPIVIDAILLLRYQRKHASEWVAVDVAKWQSSRGQGWSHASIVQTQQRLWDQFLKMNRSPNHLGRWPTGSEDVAYHNLIMTFGYIVGRAAVGRNSLSILDLGGGLGHFYVYARELFPELDLSYFVKELPEFCSAGQRLLQEATFVSDDETALGRRYNLLFASASAHYTFDFYDGIRRLAASAENWLVVTRLPCISNHPDFVVAQRPRSHGYLTEYFCWFINRGRFLAFVETCGFRLEREFLLAEEPFVKGAPEQCHYTGFLFRRINYD